MPLPQRKPDESHEEFIERCMGDPVMIEEFPDAAQRRAVCERQARMRTQAQLNLVCDPGSITIEAAEEGQGDGRPKLPRFSMVAYTGGPMRIAGWRYPVIVDLAGLVIPSQSRPIRFGHDMASGVGHTDAIRIEDGRLVATGVVSRDTQAAREIVASARNGFPWQASIGAAVEELEFIKENQKVLVNGRQFSGPLNVIRRAILGEISFVDLGADGATSASIAASIDSCEQENLSMENLSDTLGAAPQIESSGTVNQSQTHEIHDAEVARILAIRRICEGRYPDIEARAIEEGWTERQTALAIVRANRPRAPIVVHETGSAWRDLVIAALAWRGGVQPPASLRSDAARWRDAPLSVIARQACELEGISLPMSATPRQWIEAAFSTRSLPSILKESAQKILLDSYQAVDRASLRVSKVLEAVDFKPHTLTRLVGQYRFEKVAPDGEIPHAEVADQGYAIKVDTYGRLVGLTRQDIINDDLGAFLEIPRQLGRGAALALESAFWTMVEAANGTFFAAANGNVISGDGSKFGVAGLNAAIAKLRKQKDEHGNPIKARPRFVAVPPDLEADATQIYTSNVLLIAGQSDRTVAANNPHANKYEPIVSEYLTGNGASSVWYLIADPADVPSFGVAFLRGQQAPIIEEADPDPKYLGTLWRGYFDFGVALLDPRGAVRAAGQ